MLQLTPLSLIQGYYMAEKPLMGVLRTEGILYRKTSRITRRKIENVSLTQLHLALAKRDKHSVKPGFHLIVKQSWNRAIHSYFGSLEKD